MTEKTVVVPVEPTEAMLKAGQAAADDKYWVWRGYGPRPDGSGLDGMMLFVRDAYAAMLAARPPSPPGDVGELVAKRAPVQGYSAGIPWSMHLRAYDAYSKKWSPQPALIDLEGRNCRGGFSTRELDDFIPGWRDELSEITRLKAEIERLTSDCERLERENKRLREGQLNAPSDDVLKLLDGVIGAVEANSYESLCLWQEHGKDAGWQSAGWGLLATVGTFAGMPVCISLTTATVEGHKVLVYEPTSAVVDHRMIDRWLVANLPASAMRDNGSVNKADAMNFSNILPRASLSQDAKEKT